MRRRDLLQSALPFALPDTAPEGQRRRRLEIYALHQRACASLFDDRGLWTGAHTEETARLRFWHAMSLIDNPATRDRGNAVILRAFADAGRLAAFSHFEFCAAAQMLVRARPQLSARSAELLTGLLRTHLAEPRAIRWLGRNDNFPAMQTLSQCLGGDAVSNPEARRRGLDGIGGLLEYFERRGLLSEYTSPTYTPITLLCFADIAEHSADPEVRRLALQVEEHIWMDLAVHFHAPTCLLAGPHSRAYHIDSCGHPHQVQMTLYHVFGERIWMNPSRFLFPPVSGQLVHHEGDVPFMQASAVWLAGSTYHPSPQVARTLLDKPFPYRVTATCEHGPDTGPVMQWDAAGKRYIATGETMEYPGGEIVNTTYLTAAYGVGSASGPYSDGNQTDAFFVNFLRARQPRSLADVSTIFCRYTVDRDGPGVRWVDPRKPDQKGTLDMLGDAGRVRTLQKDGTALVLYQPKGQFLREFAALRLTLIVPIFYRDVKRVFAAEGNVWLEDDCFYAAFRPLLLTNHGRTDAVRITRENGYLAIHLINYEGPPRRFTRRELVETLNGFVAELGSPGDDGAFENFQRRVLAGRVDDAIRAGTRMTCYRRPGVRLDLCHTLYYNHLKYALVDGRAQPRPSTLNTL